MSEHEFVLRLRLPDAAADPECYVAALAMAGCDDATVGIGKPGMIALMFARDAHNRADAIASALRNVRKAIPRATLLEVGSEYGI
jgi:hypothetical protein